MGTWYARRHRSAVYAEEACEMIMRITLNKATWGRTANENHSQRGGIGVELGAY